MYIKPTVIDDTHMTGLVLHISEGTIHVEIKALPMVTNRDFEFDDGEHTDVGTFLGDDTFLTPTRKLLEACRLAKIFIEPALEHTEDDEEFHNIVQQVMDVVNDAIESAEWRREKP